MPPIENDTTTAGSPAVTSTPNAPANPSPTLPGTPRPAAVASVPTSANPAPAAAGKPAPDLAGVTKEAGAILKDALSQLATGAREAAAGYIEEMAPAMASAAADLSSVTQAGNARNILEAIRISAVLRASQMGVGVQTSGENALGVAITVGVNVLARIIRGA